MSFTSKEANHLQQLMLKYIEHPTDVKLDLIRRNLRAGAVFHDLTTAPNAQQWQSFIDGVGEAVYQTVADDKKNPIAFELTRLLEQTANNDVKQVLLYQLTQSEQLLQTHAVRLHRMISDYVKDPIPEKLDEIRKQVDQFNKLHALIAAFKNPEASREDRLRVGSAAFVRKHELRTKLWNQHMMPYLDALCMPLDIKHDDPTYWRLNSCLSAHGSTGLFEVLPQQLNTSATFLPTTGNELFRKLIAHILLPSPETLEQFQQAFNQEHRRHLVERTADSGHSLFDEALTAIFEKYGADHETAGKLVNSMFTLFTENLRPNELQQIFFVPNKDGQLPLHLFIRLANKELIQKCVQTMKHIAQLHSDYPSLFAALILTNASGPTELGHLLIAADIQTCQSFSGAITNLVAGAGYLSEELNIHTQLERITAQRTPDITYSSIDPASVSLIDEFRIANPDLPNERIKLVCSAEKLAQLKDRCATVEIVLNESPDQRPNMFVVSLEYGRKYFPRGIEPDAESVLTDLLKAGVITPAFKDQILASELTRQRQSSMARVVSAEPKYAAVRLYPQVMHFALPSERPTRVEPITPHPSLVGKFAPGK